MNIDAFDGKNVVFVGVGRGRSFDSFHDFATKHSKALSVMGVDKQDGAEPLAFLKDYDPAVTVFVKNEGIPSTEMPVPYLTNMNLFFELVGRLGARTVGITGTKGKSTTTALTAAMLRAGGLDVVLGGNIGVSVFENLENATKDTVFVLELSSYQLSDIKYSPNVAICINLFNDHADWHGSQEKYWEAKHNIMRFSGPEDLFIYNPDFPALQEWAAGATCRTAAIDAEENISMENAALYGEHNRLNALAARMAARELGVLDEDCQTALNSFKPLEHRMEQVPTQDSHIFINDAIGMTPESTMASMKAVTAKHGPIGCLFLGGQDRGYDFSELIAEVAKANIPNLVLFPDTEETFKKMLPEGYTPQIFETKDMDEAVKWAAEHAPAGSVVLMSTAAPSYSAWSGFEEKGTLFKAAVAKL
ncbi:MAG: UDP-N-acetylmuramoylalanine--D-glutamate ligase [Candidatus Saccharibacteria bacterium]|nr:UDP-N-acetylmuramoylalanine--D-glutamate ligase [Candidatus Saccharibacteria bacterium]